MIYIILFIRWNYSILRYQISGNISNRYLVVACKCTATKGNDNHVISFDFEMQNQYKYDDRVRFSEYGTLLKSTQPYSPIKLLVLLNRKGGDTSGNFKVVETINQISPSAESQQMNQIDIQDIVSKILKNEPVDFIKEGEIRELSDEALEWIKLFGVDHWSTKIENERYVVPSGDSISSESVRNAVSFLSEFDQHRYEAINAQFHADMANMFRDIEEARNEDRLRTIWNFFIKKKEGKGLDKSDFVVEDTMERKISFSSGYVDYFLNSQEDKKVISFLHALKNVGLLED